MLYANGQPVGGGGAGGNTNSVELTYAEYLALSDAEKMNGTEYFITDINGDGSQFQPVIYSTTEREIGVWIDGKPLYEKTIDCGALPNNTTKTVSYNVSNVEKITYIEGVGIASNGGAIPIPFVDDASKNADMLCDVSVPNANIRFISRGDKSAFNGYITLRYTKTTDTAGSGTWTPQGVPAVHYSTDEQIIGTWIDGKTLYEKTFDLTGISDNLTVGDWTTVMSNLTGIEKIIDAKSLQNESVISFIEYSYDSANSRLYGKSLRQGANDYVRYLTLQYTKSS